MAGGEPQDDLFLAHYPSQLYLLCVGLCLCVYQYMYCVSVFVFLCLFVCLHVSQRFFFVCISLSLSVFVSLSLALQVSMSLALSSHTSHFTWIFSLTVSCQGSQSLLQILVPTGISLRLCSTDGNPRAFKTLNIPSHLKVGRTLCREGT